MLVIMFVLNIILLDTHVIYVVTFAGQCLFYLLSIAGYVCRSWAGQPGIFRIPYYFCLVNVASGVGLIEAMFGKSYTTWNTARADDG